MEDRIAPQQLVEVLASALRSHGPQVILDAVHAAAAPADPGAASAVAWWPQPVDRSAVGRVRDGITRLVKDLQLSEPGPVAVALVETLAEILADCAGAQGLHAALLNLIPTLQVEAERRLEPEGQA